MDDESRHWTADIRRRMRAHMGPATHALKILAEAFKQRGKYMMGARVLLVGFDEAQEPQAVQEAARIEETLVKHGAEVEVLAAEELSGDTFRERLFKLVKRFDAILIDTDSKHFRALRPKELRDRGADIVIATTLHA